MIIICIANVPRKPDATMLRESAKQILCLVVSESQWTAIEKQAATKQWKREMLRIMKSLCKIYGETST